MSDPQFKERYDVNSCTFIGRLGEDPEARYLEDGTSVCNFSIAVQKGKVAMWVRCVAWKKLGDICGEYLKKGTKVYVCGRMDNRKYDKDGVSMISTEIVLREMQML
jgi:single-strand DNA-binding protein